jgi:hypothetical protein
MRRLLILSLLFTACHKGSLGEGCRPDGTCDGALVCTRDVGGNFECAPSQSFIDVGINKLKSTISNLTKPDGG